MMPALPWGERDGAVVRDIVHGVSCGKRGIGRERVLDCRLTKPRRAV